MENTTTDKINEIKEKKELIFNTLNYRKPKTLKDAIKYFLKDIAFFIIVIIGLYIAIKLRSIL